MENNQIGNQVASDTITGVVNSPSLPSETTLAAGPNPGPPEMLAISQCHRRWLQGKSQSSVPTVLPPGVCNTVYYIDKNGVYKHFTPGLPPKKKVRDGPNWGTAVVEMDAAQNPTTSDDEDIKIPDALC